jgi:hypothetical protein
VAIYLISIGATCAASFFDVRTITDVTSATVPNRMTMIATARLRINYAFAQSETFHRQKCTDKPIVRSSVDSYQIFQ